MGRDAVTLVNPPSPKGWTANREGAGGLGVLVRGRGGFVYPSLLLAEAAGWLRDRGVSVRVHDHVVDSLPRRLLAGGLTERVILRVSARTLDADLEWARARLGPRRRVLVAAPGVTPRDVPDRWLWSSRPDGHTAAARLFGMTAPDMETASFADWSRVPLGRSRRPGIHHARGCDRSCAYCPYVVATGREVVSRSPERTLEEAAFHVAAGRIKRLVFRDPTFGLGDGVPELLEGLASLRTPFEVESRPEVLTDDLLEALAAAGCAEVKVGLETLSAPALIRSGRVADHEEVESYDRAIDRVLATADRLGLPLRLFLLEGLPEQADDALPARLAGRPDVVTKAVATWPAAGLVGGEA